MTPNETNADEASRGAAPWTPALPGMRNPVETPLLNSRRRIQTVAIAATSVVATIWFVGVIWAWQVIG